MNRRFFYIVVPVFKAEKFIVECYNSVANQTYDNWQLILIDDGSPDKSGFLCDKLKLKDERVVTIHQKNQGQIAARMSGNRYILKNMKPNSFIVYLDSDDTLALNALETINATIDRDKSDVVIYRWQRIKDGNILHGSQSKGEYYGVVRDKRLLYKIVFMHMYYNSMCLKSISTDLLQDDDFSKYFHIRHGEDLIQSISYYKNCVSVSFIDSVLYNYRINEESVTQTVDHNNFSMDSTVRSKVLDFLKREDVWTDKDYFEYALCMQKFLKYDLLTISSFPISYERKLLMFNNIRCNKYYSEILSVKSSSIYINLFKRNLNHIIIIIGKLRFALANIYHKIK